MKKLLAAIPLIVSILLTGCTDISSNEELKDQLEELTSSQIASIDTQITNIRKSIEDLEGVDKALNDLIAKLQKEMEEQGKDLDELAGKINELISASQALNTRIDELKSYCDQQDNAVKNWAEVTFATLEQHSAVLTEISTIKNSLSALNQAISDLDSSLTGKIADAESSIKSWVNEQLTGYYTIAQTEAKLKALEDGYAAGDEALSTEIETLRQNLDQAKADLTTAYQAAITSAISEYDGVISEKIAADIKTAADALQAQIDTLSGRLDAVESRLSALEASLAKLIGMVQSVVVVPDYSDGAVKMTNSEENPIRFEVYPLAAAEKLAEAGTGALSLDCVETETKAGVFTNIPISAVVFDGEIFTITADGSGLPEALTSGESSANARLRISDGTVTRSSEYFPLAFSSAAPGGDEASAPLEAPAKAKYSKKIYMNVISTPISVTTQTGEVAPRKEFLSIEFTEGGKYIITLIEVEAKKVGDLSYLTGTYETNDGTSYNLTGDTASDFTGTITVETSQENPEEVTVTVEGTTTTTVVDEGTGEEKDVVVTVSGTDESATEQETIEETDLNVTLARTWKVDRVSIFADVNGATVSVTRNDCDLPALAKELNQKGKLGIEESKLDGFVVKDIIFTRAKTFAIEFSGQEPFVGEFELSPEGTFHYEFSGSVGNSVLSAKADGKVEWNAEDKQLEFTIKPELSGASKGYKGTVFFYLSEL